MEERTASRIGKVIRTIGAAGIAASAFLYNPSSVSAWGLSGTAVNKISMKAREIVPGYLEKNFDKYNVFLAGYGADKYIVADVKDSRNLGNEIRAYIRDASPVTLDEFKSLKKKFGGKDVSLEYQVHALNGFVRGHDDYILAFISKLGDASDVTKENLAEKVGVNSKFVADEFTRSFDRKNGRTAPVGNVELKQGFGYEMHWIKHMDNGGSNGGQGGSNGGSGGVGGVGGSGGSAGG